MQTKHEHAFSKARMEALTDGIFGTVMTILILSLIVPIITSGNQSKQLGAVIFSLLPNIFVYVFSFAVLLVMWIGHNNLFRFSHGINPRVIWLNGLFLLLIGMVPLSTAFLGRYPLQQPAIFFYGINFLLLAIVFMLFNYYIRKHHEGNPSNLAQSLTNTWIGTTLYVCALAFSFVSPYLSLGFFAMMPLFWLYQAFFGIYRRE